MVKGRIKIHPVMAVKMLEMPSAKQRIMDSTPSLGGVATLASRFPLSLSPNHHIFDGHGGEREGVMM